MKKIILYIFLLSSWFLNLFSYDGCNNATTLSLNETLSGQKIDTPFVQGTSGGKALYYKIVLPQDGNFVILSAKDSQNPNDTVNTHARLLDENCKVISGVTEKEIHTNPRYFKFDEDLKKGIYYLRVYNEVQQQDTHDDLAKGYFELKNLFSNDVALKDISISKNYEHQINSGDEIVYSIKVKNEGSSPIKSIQITDPLPSPHHLTFLGNDSQDWVCSNNDPIICNFDTQVNSGEIKELKLRYKADYQTTDRTVSNTTSVDVKFDDDSSLHKDFPTSELLIKKAEADIDISQDAQNEALEDEEFTFYVNVKNSGVNITDENVIVEGKVSSNFKLVDLIHDDSWVDCSFNANQEFTCKLDYDLEAGDEDGFEIKVKTSHPPANGVKLYDATVKANTAMGDISDSDSKNVDILARKSEISITKNASSNTVVVNHQANFRIRVENSGEKVLHDIEVKDILPHELELISFSNENGWDCSSSDISNNIVDCKLTALDINQIKDFQINFKGKIVADDVSSTATVTTQEDVSDDADESIDVIKQTPGISITKRVSKSTVYSLETYEYTINVENNGTEDINNLVVKDNIDSRLTLPNNWNSKSGANWDCSNDANKISCKYKNILHPNEKADIKIIVKAPLTHDNTTIDNIASADIGSSSDDDHVEVTILPPKSILSIKKDSTKDKILDGDIFSYIIFVKNNGDDKENNLTVTDQIADDFTIQDIKADGWSCTNNNNKISCNLSSLNSHENASDINITVKAPEKIVENRDIINQAKIVSQKDTKGKVSSKTVSLVKSDTALEVTLESKPKVVYENNEYYYLVTLKNSSAKDIDNIKVEQKIDDGLTYVKYWSEDDGFDCHYDDANKLFSCNNKNTFKDKEIKNIKLYVLAPNHEGNITHNVQVSSSLDNNKREKSVTTKVLPKYANLVFSLSKSDKDIAKVEEEFHYTFKIKNIGSKPSSDINASNIKLLVNLDSNLTYVSHSFDYNCSYQNHLLSCDIPVLKLQDETNILDIVVKGMAESKTTTVARIESEQLKKTVSKKIDVDVVKQVKIDIGLTLSDSYDPVNADEEYSYKVNIKNFDSNKIAKGVTLDINTTSEYDYDLIDYSEHSDFDCNKYDKHLVCKLKIALQPLEDKELILKVKAPHKSTKINLSAFLHSIYVDDIDITNNTAKEDTTVIFTDLTGNNTREFTKVPLQGMVDLNIYGELLTIGNQSICYKKGDKCVEPIYDTNDYLTQNYINLDPVYAKNFKNATKAKLNLDPTDEVVWAGLYWMGRIDKGNPNYLKKIQKSNVVYFRADSNSSGYIKLTAQRHAEAIDNNGTKIVVDKFNFINSSRYFDYQGFSDVTSYVKANRSGDYWVANVQSSEGDNLSAGWNLVVIVRDTKAQPTRDLKNITIFDGFEGVWKSPDGVKDDYPDEINQTVSGFLTPTTGPIKSKLIFFAFEGDKGLKDYIKVSDSTGVMFALENKTNKKDDTANGTITKYGEIVPLRSPSLKNTSGIDVDEFSLGDVNDSMGTGIIDNGQTSTKISIGSSRMESNGGGGDRFYLGMFGFSTNLRDPMCYVQKFTNVDFSQPLGDSVHLGDKIGIEVEFHNKEIQKLENMHAYSLIDDAFSEDNTTFELKNIGESSFSKQKELFKFGKVKVVDENRTEVTTSIGKGATSSYGGSIDSGESIFIRFNAIVDKEIEDNTTNNIYSVSYEPSANKKIEISRCLEDDQKLHVLRNYTNGFEVIHQGGLSDGVNDGFINQNVNQPSNENHLFTQIVDNNFSVDIVALDDTNSSLVKTDENFKGLLKVDIAEFNQSVSNQFNSCNQFSSINPATYLFMQESNNNRKTINIKAVKASKHALMRVGYLVDKYGRYVTWKNSSDSLEDLQQMVKDNQYGDKRCQSECQNNKTSCLTCLFKAISDGGYAKFSCSSDLFSIRPKNIQIETNSTTLIGAKKYKIKLDANSTNYNQTITNSNNGKFEYNLINPGGCNSDLNGSLLGATNSINFVNGEANLTNFTYKNVGDINVTIVDHSWTAIDQNLTDSNMSDCIVGSNQINHTSLKVGCNIKGSKNLTFIPARFKNDFISLDNFKNNFTYISNDSNMSAKFRFKIKALLDDNTSATNFSKNCYARDVNYTISLSGLPNPEFFPTSSSWTDNNLSGRLKTTEGNFTNGESTVSVGINNKRDKNKASEPFMLNSKDINISTSDVNSSIVGAGLSLVVDKNVTFYYGRLNVPDIVTDLKDLNVTFYDEIYCKTCDRSKFVLANSPESSDSIYWYIVNKSHTDESQGKFSDITSENGMSFANKSYNNIEISLGSHKAPHSDKISYKPSSWLIYNKFNPNSKKSTFNITVLSTATKWSGKGSKGMTVDNNLSRKTTRKLEW